MTTVKNSPIPVMVPPLTELSVVFPAFNDAATIGKLVDEAAALLPGLAPRHEIIVVNDGSTDATAEVLQAARARHTCLRVVTHATNRGYGMALRNGFAACTLEHIFYTDGDGQYALADLPKLVAALPGYNWVNGYKIKRSDPWYRCVIGPVYCRLMRAIFKVNIRDINCDFRLFQRRALADIEFRATDGAFCTEMIVKAQRRGVRFSEVPVRHLPRTSGRSQIFTPGRIAYVLVELWRLWREPR